MRAIPFILGSAVAGTGAYFGLEALDIDLSFGLGVSNLDADALTKALDGTGIAAADLTSTANAISTAHTEALEATKTFIDKHAAAILADTNSALTPAKDAITAYQGLAADATTEAKNAALDAVAKAFAEVSVGSGHQNVAAQFASLTDPAVALTAKTLSSAAAAGASTNAATLASALEHASALPDVNAEALAKAADAVTAHGTYKDTAQIGATGLAALLGGTMAGREGKKQSHVERLMAERRAMAMGHNPAMA